MGSDFNIYTNDMRSKNQNEVERETSTLYSNTFTTSYEMDKRKPKRISLLSSKEKK